MSLPAKETLIEAVTSVVEPRARMGELHLSTAQFVRQELKQRQGLDEGSLLEPQASLKDVTQNTLENTPSDSGVEEGSKADVPEEPGHKEEGNDGRKQPSSGPIMSSKRKRAEPSSKPENSRRKKAVRAKFKPPLISDEEYSKESEAETKKYRPLDPSNVEAAAPFRREGKGLKAKTKESADKRSDIQGNTPENDPRSGTEQADSSLKLRRSPRKPKPSQKRLHAMSRISAKKAPDIRKSGTMQLLSGAHRLAIQGSEFKTAGKDIHTSYHINLNTPLVNFTGLLQDLGVFGFFQQIFDFFRSPESRSASGEVLYSIRDRTAIREALRETPPAHASADHEDNDKGTQFLEETDYTLAEMSNLNIREVKTQAAMTSPEIYTRCMMCSGDGLPCWYPEPHPSTGETGIVPGDVGTFDLMNGFRKIFNLWEDVFAAKHLLPPMESTVRRNLFRQGHTIVKGMSCRTCRSDNRSHITSYHFQSTAKEGAVLVCTTPADLEELVDAVALRRFLLKHARAVYQHANGVRMIGDHESLFVVTGSIKSDSWGLAAYENPTERPSELEFSRIDQDDNGPLRLPSYDWETTGIAVGRLGSNSEKVGEDYRGKDQTLFLRGMTLAFSQEFRNRTNTRLQVNLEDDLHNLGAGGTHPNAEGSWHNASLPCNEMPTNGTTKSTGGAADSVPGSVQVNYFPAHSSTVYNPGERIAQFLLELTGADCALCPDDDWRRDPNFSTPSWGDVACLDIVASKTIGVVDGVTYLIPGYEKAAAGTQQQGIVGSPAPTNNGISPPPQLSGSGTSTPPDDLPLIYERERENREHHHQQQRERALPSVSTSASAVATSPIASSRGVTCSPSPPNHSHPGQGVAATSPVLTAPSPSSFSQGPSSHHSHGSIHGPPPSSSSQGSPTSVFPSARDRERIERERSKREHVGTWGRGDIQDRDTRNSDLSEVNERAYREREHHREQRKREREREREREVRETRNREMLVMRNQREQEIREHEIRENDARIRERYARKQETIERAQAAASGMQQQQMVGPLRYSGGSPPPRDIIMTDYVEESVVEADFVPSYHDRDPSDRERDPREASTPRDYDLYDREGKEGEKQWGRELGRAMGEQPAFRKFTESERVRERERMQIVQEEAREKERKRRDWVELQTSEREREQCEAGEQQEGGPGNNRDRRSKTWIPIPSTVKGPSVPSPSPRPSLKRGRPQRKPKDDADLPAPRWTCRLCGLNNPVSATKKCARCEAPDLGVAGSSSSHTSTAAAPEW